MAEDVVFGSGRAEPRWPERESRLLDLVAAFRVLSTYQGETSIDTSRWDSIVEAKRIVEGLGAVCAGDYSAWRGALADAGLIDRELRDDPIERFFESAAGDAVSDTPGSGK